MDATAPAPSGEPDPGGPAAGPERTSEPAADAAGATDVARENARIAAFFDLDNTLVRGASAFHLALGLRRRGFLQVRDVLEFAVLQARYLALGENVRQIDHLRRRGLSIVAGRSVAEIAAIGEEVWDEVLSLRIFPGAHELLVRHLSAGHQVWIITASPVEIGSLIAARLGATGALGTVAEHVDGFYTGRLVGDLLHGSAKAAAVRRLADEHDLELDRCHAYGDSGNDLAILSAVGHPVAINPDARLRRYAQAQGWPVRDFRGRSRAAARHGMRAASWAGAAWVAGLALRSVRRALRG